MSNLHHQRQPKVSVANSRHTPLGASAVRRAAQPRSPQPCRHLTQPSAQNPAYRRVSPARSSRAGAATQRSASVRLEMTPGLSEYAVARTNRPKIAIADSVGLGEPLIWAGV